MSDEFRVGSTDADHLSIAVLSREHAGADDYWDGNWVLTNVSVVAGGFTGQVRASLRMDEIHRFNEGLKFLNQNLLGAAVLNSMEDWITLTVKAGSRGQIEVSGELADGAGAGNVLTFELPEMDQTYLRSWISNLDDIEKVYPVLRALSEATRSSADQCSRLRQWKEAVVVYNDGFGEQLSINLFKTRSEGTS